jgi:hypothetical protein
MSISCWRADLVMVVLDRDAHLLERADRVAADAGGRVERRLCEVAALVERLRAFSSLNRKYSASGPTLKVSNPIASIRSSARRARSAGRRVRLAVRRDDVADHPRRRPRAARNVSGSGIATMSDSSIALKPVIDEPSKPIPSSSAPRPR